MEHAEQVH